MTPATEAFPDVTGRWEGQWWFEFDEPLGLDRIPLEGHVTIAAQRKGNLRGEAASLTPEARVRYRIAGTVDPDGSTVLALNEELENSLEEPASRVTQAATAATGAFHHDHLELELEVAALEEASGRPAVLRFRGELAGGEDGSGQRQRVGFREG